MKNVVMFLLNPLCGISQRPSSDKRMMSCDPSGEKQSWEKALPKACFQKGLWLQPKTSCCFYRMSWDVAHLMKCYCHLTTTLFFSIWVWYWNILLSREPALIKYYNMNNICKYVRHIFHSTNVLAFSSTRCVCCMEKWHLIWVTT